MWRGDLRLLFICSSNFTWPQNQTSRNKILRMKFDVRVILKLAFFGDMSICWIALFENPEGALHLIFKYSKNECNEPQKYSTWRNYLRYLKDSEYTFCVFTLKSFLTHEVRIFIPNTDRRIFEIYRHDIS